MRNIEIPYVENRGKRYRFFEMLPGLLSWSILALPFVLSFTNAAIHVFGVPLPISGIFIMGYLLIWFAKAVGLNIRAIQGYQMITLHQKLPWSQMLTELTTGKPDQPDRHIPTWHYEHIVRLSEQPTPIKAEDIVHAIIIATYNEGREVLEPTIQSVLASDYDSKKVILVMAYEERNGAQSEPAVQELIAQYGSKFKHAFAVKHPVTPKEVRGKGGNITYAARELTNYVSKQQIDPLNVIVTTLDSDNRPHKYYLAALSYLYAVTPDPKYVSYQPVPIYNNNIWDAPAPMRVIATGNSFWNMVLSVRTHMIRNFSAHAQSLQTLIDTDYWSVRTIVEDGHQFWRTYFRYEGHHEVYPLYVPIYQDAVLSDTLWKTLKAQFVQLRRWAWGASDVAYVAEKGFFTENKVPKLDLIFKFGRLLEGHVTWAVAPLILAFSAFIPGLINANNLGPIGFTTNQLPHMASQIQRVALTGIIITLYLSVKMLPPKPLRYKRHRSVFMILQWFMLPVTTIAYNSFAALNSQTRLIFGKYLAEFDVTDKAVVNEDNQKIL
ncbi:MAG TPA: glycosyltransferase family 2 protein [Candidatus Limnocylindrales bacterium]|nr:glycosyltransferase family 2 protein [Candidatus Limnocylindrales bacterium]